MEERKIPMSSADIPWMTMPTEAGLWLQHRTDIPCPPQVIHVSHYMAHTIKERPNIFWYPITVLVTGK